MSRPTIRREGPITDICSAKFGYFWTNREYDYELRRAVLCIAIFFNGGGRY